MNFSPDIIVVGAGLGGLAAALESARRGMKTLLLEQHNLPGGFATSFIRGRFEFEPSLHEMPDVKGNQATGVVRYLKEEAGLEVEFHPVPEAYRLILTGSGLDVSLPFGKEQYIETIARKVPGSEKPVREYMDLCGHVQEAFNYLRAARESPDIHKILKNYGNFLRTAGYPARRIARALEIPQMAEDLLYPYWCYLGVPMERVSFPIWAALLNTYIANGAVIPARRSHEISAAFCEEIEKAGGMILYNTRAEKILAEKGRIRGVLTDSGLPIYADRVISNASPTLVFGSLLDPPAKVPVAALNNIRNRTHGLTLMVVYLGLNRSMEDLGLCEYSYFIAPHMDTSRLYSAAGTLGKDIMQAAVCLNAAIPDCSPPGTTILAITAGYRPEAWAGVSPREYEDVKNALALRLIRQFESATGTDIRSHIEEIEIATPQTFARYTGAYDGIIYGYEPEPWDSIIPRALSQKRENYIEGLRFCGGYASRCHGYGSSILSGKAAAEELLSGGGR